MEFYSHEKQDVFVYELLAKHLDGPGFFLDIACGHPTRGSNTYALESQLDWRGIGFDIGDIEANHNWSEIRKSRFIQADARAASFTDLLKAEVGDQVVDYLSLDVDAAGSNFSAEVLDRILDAGITFKVMTLEHESFKTGDSVTGPTRTRLWDNGYEMLFKDVRFTTPPPLGDIWEDWWVKAELLPIREIVYSSLVKKDILEIARTGANFEEAIATVQRFMEDATFV
jgi:hypothetical protein